jgi:hypothetical protein
MLNAVKHDQTFFNETLLIGSFIFLAFTVQLLQ